MWSERPNTDLTGKLMDYITYFEGTCEFCISNMGIMHYKNEIRNMLNDDDDLTDEQRMLANYVYGVILYKQDELDDAFTYWERAEAYARELGNEEFIAKIISYMSIYYYVNKNFAKCKRYFDEAEKLFEKHQLYSELALHYINLLWYKRYESNKAIVMEYLDKAFYYVQQSNSRKDARTYLHLGYIYKTIFNDFITGLKYLTTARDMCYQNGNVEMESMTLHVLADGYMHLGHFEEAIAIYNDLMKDPRYKDITPSLKCMILTNITECYIALNDIQSAVFAVKSMRDNIEETQESVREQFSAVYSWLKASLNLYRKEKILDVPELLRIGREIYERYKSNFALEEFDYKLQETTTEYFIAVGDINMALSSCLMQAEYASRYGSTTERMAFGKLASLYEATGDYEKALEYRKKEIKVAEEIEKVNLVSQYDKLFKEFIRYTQEQKLDELKKEQEELKDVAFNDELTGLHNRAYLGDLLNKKRGELANGDSFIMLDIDCFKRYNDNYGHAEGDNVLAKVAEAINYVSMKNSGDAIRYGGEEFLVILNGKGKDGTLFIANEIVSAVSMLGIEHIYSLVEPHVTISAGCYVPDMYSDEKFEEMIDKADKALYHVKQNGRNKAYLYGSEG